MRGVGWGGKGAKVSDFFTKYPNLKKKNFGGGGGEGCGLVGEGGLEQVIFFFFTKNPNLKKNFFGGGGGGGRGGLGGMLPD